VKYYFYVDKEDYNKYFGKEHALLILNHKYEIDWLTAWGIHDRMGILGVSFFSRPVKYNKKETLLVKTKIIRFMFK